MTTSTNESVAQLEVLLDAAIETFGSVPSWIRLSDEVSAQLHPPQPPVIGLPDAGSYSARVGEEIRVPLHLSSGDKPVRWMIESVSIEAVASQLLLTPGLLSGWTPEIEHSGMSLQVAVVAENCGGRDVREICIDVAEIGPLVVAEVGSSLLPAEMNQADDDEFRPGDRVVVESGADGLDGPISGSVVSLPEPPLPPEFRWVLFDSAEGRFFVQLIRESNIRLLSRLKVGDRVKIVSVRQRRLHRLSTPITSSGAESGEPTAGEIIRHAGTQCVVKLNQDQAVHCFTEALVAMGSPFLGPDQCSYLGYVDYVLRWLVPGMRVGAIEDSEQIGTAWARDGRSFTVRWDEGSTPTVNAGQLLVFG